MNVLVTGFDTTEEAEEFVSWFSGQGEQDALIWFQENHPQGKYPMTRDGAYTRTKWVNGLLKADTVFLPIEMRGGHETT
jgi:hypothetical protein